MGFDQDLNKAWKKPRRRPSNCSRAAQASRRAGREADARVSDCRVSQVVNIKKGIHCRSPKDPTAREDMERPTNETAKYYVSHATDADLNKAMDSASMGMIKWLETQKKIARLDAYGLASAAMDCRVGKVSDTEKNVHCLMPKSLWQRRSDAGLRRWRQGLFERPFLSWAACSVPAGSRNRSRS